MEIENDINWIIEKYPVGELAVYYDKLMNQENPDMEKIQMVKTKILEITQKTDFDEAYKEAINEYMETNRYAF